MTDTPEPPATAEPEAPTQQRGELLPDPEWLRRSERMDIRDTRIVALDRAIQTRSTSGESVESLINRATKIEAWLTR